MDKKTDKKIKDYQEYVEKISPKTNLGLQMAKAFVTGGIICCILIDTKLIHCGIYYKLSNTADNSTCYKCLCHL